MDLIHQNRKLRSRKSRYFTLLFQSSPIRSKHIFRSYIDQIRNTEYVGDNVDEYIR